MLREWLVSPERVLWSFGIVPFGALIGYLTLMGIRWRKKGERPRRIIRWALPAMVLVGTYYVWGFETPLVKAVAYVGGGALLWVAETLMLDGVYVGTQRYLSRAAEEEAKSTDTH